MDEAHAPREIANALWVESPFAHPTVMMRREAYDAAGGYRSDGFPEDYDLWLRMNRASIRLAKLPDRLYRWTDRPDRASRTLPEYTTQRFLECRAHHLRRHLGSRPVVIWGAGRDGKRASKQLLSEGLALDAGPFVAALEYATRVEAVVVGKPSPHFFRLAAVSMGVAPEMVTVVGDDLEADVGGAQRAGMRGVLVRTGKFREEELERSEVRPDLVVGTLIEATAK